MSDTHISDERLRQAAKELLDQLFVNGFGQEAERLVLMSADGKDLGGWCKQAVLDTVESVFQRERRQRDRGIPVSEQPEPEVLPVGDLVDDFCADIGVTFDEEARSRMKLLAYNAYRRGQKNPLV